MHAAIQKFRFFTVTVIGTFLFLFLAMSFINIIFDPLHILRAPAEKSLYDRQTRYALPGLVRHHDAPFAIVGTSVIQDFDEDYFEQSRGQKITRYPLLGGTGYEQKRLVETLIASKNPPQTIIWGLDVASYSGELNRIRWAQFPEHLFSNGWMVYPRYIFSFETFYRALRLIPDYKKTYTPHSRFVFEAPDLEFSKNAVLKSYCGDGQEKRIENLKSFDFSTQDQQIKANIIAPIRNAPQTQFILFLPPYSAVQYAEFNRAAALHDLLSFRENLLKAVQGLDNVKLYDFQTVAHIVENLNDYRDPFHYGEATMHWMSDTWQSDAHMLTSDNLDERQQTLIDLAAQYSIVWKEVDGYCGGKNG